MISCIPFAIKNIMSLLARYTTIEVENKGG